MLAQLYASGFLPEVWIADEATQALRRQVTRRNQIVRQRSRLKNIIQSILHAHLIPSCPHQDLCGPTGRAWLSEQILPGDERLAVERHLRLREFDRLTDDLKVIERDLAQSALADDRATRLMTIPGINNGRSSRADRRNRRYQALCHSSTTPSSMCSSSSRLTFLADGIPVA